MATQTKADLEKELKETKKGLEQFKDHTREEIIKEATNQGLTCEVLDEFLERVGMEPRGNDFEVTVPVHVRADSEEEAEQLATEGIESSAGLGMGGQSVEVDYDRVETESLKK